MKNRMMKRIALAIGAIFAACILTGTAAAVLTADAGGAQNLLGQPGGEGCIGDVVP